MSILLLPFVMLSQTDVPSIDDFELNDLVAIYEYKESLIRNLEFQVEFYDYRRESIDNPGIVENHHRLEKARYIYDSLGRVRLEHELSVRSPNGEYEPDGLSIVRTYDNEKEMIYDEYEGRKRVSIQPDDNVNSIRKPTVYSTVCGRKLPDLIAASIDQGQEPELLRSDDKYLLSAKLVQDGRDYRYEALIDPDSFYSIVDSKKYVDNQLIRHMTNTPKRIAEDVWLPDSAKSVTYGYTDAGEQIKYFETEMLVKEVFVNNDELSDAVFEVKIEDGTLVTDTRLPIPVSKYYGTDKVENVAINQMVNEIVRELKQDATPVVHNREEAATTDLGGPDEVASSLSENKPSIALLVITFTCSIGICVVILMIWKRSRLPSGGIRKF